MGEGGDRLAIPLGELEEFVPQLRSVREYMNRTGDTFDQYHDAIGDEGINDALDDFVSGWRDGRGDISDQLEGLASMGETVIRTVNDFENELVTTLQDSGGEGGDGGGQQPV
ncbi:hypothetical protein RM780_25915 [Streptomyces sp. DSM 44917]|uniref:WXG100 family type VII secretion target n=1 Tax=Streptomyces boetiae TaxID=3075541 RepID=A0ABU2LFK7_9ACTN|nr:MULTISPECIES: hypothetical protein [Streptomyces]MDT0310359.1 hypothetical protein [Streptomyces sp. DSM 44917]